MRIQHQHQAIIPSYKFRCCGNITEWGVDLNPVDDATRFTFDFQVWRPSPTVDEDECYSLVNNCIIRSTSLPADATINHVARVTPLPQDQLQFQPGDVLGFYVESHGTINDGDNGVVLLNNSSHINELVWFARINIAAQPPQTGSCPYPIGTNGELQTSTHAAPVISLSITTHSCYPSSTNLLHPSPTYALIIQNTTVESDVNIVNPRNGPTTTSTTSLSALILGMTLPVIMLVGVVVITSVLIIVVIIVEDAKTQPI